MDRLIAVYGRAAGPWIFVLSVDAGRDPIDLTAGDTLTLRIGKKLGTPAISIVATPIDATSASVSPTEAEINAAGVGNWRVDLQVTQDGRDVPVIDEDDNTSWPLEIRHAFT